MRIVSVFNNNLIVLNRHFPIQKSVIEEYVLFCCSILEPGSNDRQIQNLEIAKVLA